MFRIGEFSALARVTVVTLRHYDDVGLLKPHYVDSFTAYRYYTLDQLPRLQRILALKDLGLSLDQIGAWLETSITTDELLRMMRLKQAELQTQIDAEQARLKRLEARIQFIISEGTMPQYEVTLKEVGPMFVISERRVVPDVGAMRHLSGEVAARVADSPFKATGAAIHIYHHNGYREQNLDVEIAFPVDADDTVSRDLVRELPPYKSVASLVYVFSPEAIQQAYTEIGQWIQSNNFEVAGRVREVMLGDSTIEIQIPVIKAGEMKPLAYPLTQRTREVFKEAGEARRAFNKDYIGTEHILIGLLNVPEGLAAVALTVFGITKEAVIVKVEEKFGRGDGEQPETPTESPSLSLGVKLMFEEASTEATQLKHNYVGTEHILLGLLNQPEVAATVILAELGAPRQQVREKVLEIIAINASRT